MSFYFNPYIVCLKNSLTAPKNCQRSFKVFESVGNQNIRLIWKWIKWGKRDSMSVCLPCLEQYRNSFRKKIAPDIGYCPQNNDDHKGECTLCKQRKKSRKYGENPTFLGLFWSLLIFKIYIDTWQMLCCQHSSLQIIWIVITYISPAKSETIEKLKNSCLELPIVLWKVQVLNDK